ncbi:MAG: MFS transporter [Gemmatimonadetes bacterium]|nr:MFS transporter [Gemmatimonadota bacterium]
MSATPAPAAAVSLSPASRLRSIVGGTIGNLVEWYDWYVYSAFSLYFAGSFFPAEDPTSQLLSAAAVFAVGFLMRPIGGWLLGRHADRHGRKSALTLSVLLMCGGSLLIACTPGYEAIGVGAPALLVLARLLQGLSVGGEYGASATYLSEMAGQEHRGFWSSFQYVTLILGQLLALAVLLVLQQWLTEAELQAWGWRIPFGIGAAAAVVAVSMRRGLEETADFHRASAEAGGTAPGAPPRASVRALLAHPRAVLTVVGLTAGGTVAFYTFTTYAQKFLVNTVGFSKVEATRINAASLLVYMCLQPLVGALSDRVGRRPVLMAFGVLGTLGTYPLFLALEGAQTFGEALGLLVLALTALSGYTAINAVVKAELFPAGVRALGVGLPYAVTVSLLAGTAEYVALWFKQAGHEAWFYGYVTACIAASLLVYATMPETRDLGHLRD